MGRSEGKLPDEPVRVCFVCTGNICRSPMAEKVLKRMLAEAGLGQAVEVDSAGTGEWHLGEPMDERAAAALASAGYEAEGHVARRFQTQWLAERDLVIALDRSHLETLSRLAPEVAGSPKLLLLRSFSGGAEDGVDVDDPYYGSARGFDRTLEVIERSCRGLVEELKAVVEQRRAGPVEE